MENEWSIESINSPNHDSKISILHSHGSYKILITKKSNNLQCSFCGEKVPNYIKFQRLLLTNKSTPKLMEFGWWTSRICITHNNKILGHTDYKSNNYSTTGICSKEELKIIYEELKRDVGNKN